MISIPQFQFFVFLSNITFSHGDLVNNGEDNEHRLFKVFFFLSTPVDDPILLPLPFSSFSSSSFSFYYIPTGHPLINIPMRCGR
ncbi:hypothetical protein F5X96DRAFT_455562 [Biscogniauxia mediterranea]|nr:hypothetical protein F5X96DRAFT_455562 [Biscogniauxia mediterranea]